MTMNRILDVVGTYAFLAASLVLGASVAAVAGAFGA